MSKTIDCRAQSEEDSGDMSTLTQLLTGEKQCFHLVIFSGFYDLVFPDPPPQINKEKRAERPTDVKKSVFRFTFKWLHDATRRTSSCKSGHN